MAELPAAARAPSGFQTLHGVHVGVPEKHGPAAGLAHCVLYTRCFEAFNDRVDASHVHAHMAVPVKIWLAKSAAEAQ